MHVDLEFRDYWLAHFGCRFDTVMKLALDVYGPSSRPRTIACKNDLLAWIQTVRANPQSFPRLDLLILDQVRQDILHRPRPAGPFVHPRQSPLRTTPASPSTPRIVAGTPIRTEIPAKK